MQRAVPFCICSPRTTDEGPEGGFSKDPTGALLGQHLAPKGLQTHKQLHTSMHSREQFKITNYLTHAFGLWEEARMSGVNPRMNGRNMQSPHTEAHSWDLKQLTLMA